MKRHQHKKANGMRRIKAKRHPEFAKVIHLDGGGCRYVAQAPTGRSIHGSCTMERTAILALSRIKREIGVYCQTEIIGKAKPCN